MLHPCGLPGKPGSPPCNPRRDQRNTFEHPGGYQSMRVSKPAGTKACRSQSTQVTKPAGTKACRYQRLQVASPARIGRKSLERRKSNRGQDLANLGAPPRLPDHSPANGHPGPKGPRGPRRPRDPKPGESNDPQACRRISGFTSGSKSWNEIYDIVVKSETQKKDFLICDCFWCSFLNLRRRRRFFES